MTRGHLGAIPGIQDLRFGSRLGLWLGLGVGLEECESGSDGLEDC